MRRVPFSFALLCLLAGPVPAPAKTALVPKCTDYGKGRPLRVCTELDESALAGLGSSTKWRVWVEGDGSPIHVRLHNNSPGVVQLRGGDDQIVHMGCRRHHEVRRKVTAVGKGQAKLEARPYSDSPKREAAAIAASLAIRLAQIEAEFIERRAKLPPHYPAAAVSDLLNTTEAELLDALSYQELAALRDYVEEKFRLARTNLESSRTHRSAAFTALRPAIVLASLSPPRPIVAAPEPPAESVLDHILEIIRHLRKLADDTNLTTDLCVVSSPPGANFSMRPRLFNKWRGDRTDTEVENLYRGIYIYRISKGFRSFTCKDPEVCNLIDLVDDTKPILRCTLNDLPCRRQEGPSPAGACSGN